MIVVSAKVEVVISNGNNFDYGYELIVVLFFKKRLFLRDTISVSDVIIVVFIELCYTALHDDDGSMIIMLAALNNNNESTDDLLNTKTTPTTLLLQTVESRYNT